QGHVQSGGEPLEQGVVDGRGAGGHGVGGADRDGQGVHAGVGDEGAGLVGVGAGAGRVGVQRGPAVLAPDVAQFGLDPQPPGVGPVDGGPGGGEVLCVGQPGGVVHHGPESGVGGLAQQGVALHVVEVQGHGDGGAFGGGDG